MSKARRIRKGFICLDCKENTSKMNEYYFVHTTLWLSVVKDNKGMLCIGCLEKRLGRTLTAKDFTDCYLNDLKGTFCKKSMRYIDRLTTT